MSETQSVSSMPVTDMDGSYLVQRLEKPLRVEHKVFGKDNPFAFGGGYKNGGLSDEAMDLLRDVWRFDYMGSAEFEFGAVPEALQRIAKAPLEAFSVVVSLDEVPKNWRDKSDVEPEGEATIYVLTPSAFVDEVRERLNEWARGRLPRLKERMGLCEALRPVEDWDRDTCGWLELDNGFLFFTDEEMWRNACALFGVES